MSDNKYSENDPERTLITLDQLSQTIEVMTSVVNRLRKHLSEQIMARQELDMLDRGESDEDLQQALQSVQDTEPRESFVVEISQPESDTDKKDDKTFH